VNWGQLYQFRDEMTFHHGSAIRPRRSRAVPFPRFSLGHFKVKTVLDPSTPTRADPSIPCLVILAARSGGAGWIIFDPTNRSAGGFNLIPLAVARDIAQVVPVAGSFVGMIDAFSGMAVEVSITV
jgi:hypothetical protein